MEKITWEGFSRLGPHFGAVNEVILGLTKVATSIHVQCHFKRTSSDYVVNDEVHCVYVNVIKQVLIPMRGVLLYVSIDDVQPRYRSTLLRYGRVTITLS